MSGSSRHTRRRQTDGPTGPAAPRRVSERASGEGATAQAATLQQQHHNSFVWFSPLRLRPSVWPPPSSSVVAAPPCSAAAAAATVAPQQGCCAQRQAAQGVRLASRNSSGSTQRDHVVPAGRSSAAAAARSCARGAAAADPAAAAARRCCCPRGAARWGQRARVQLASWVDYSKQPSSLGL